MVIKLLSLLFVVSLSASHSRPSVTEANLNVDADTIAGMEDGCEQDSISFPNAAHGRVMMTTTAAANTTVKKGAHCNVTNNICDGVWVNKGKRKSLLHCCKNHCRNILSDRNNCGMCGHKCGFSQLCCNSMCRDVKSDAAHCGKCHRSCEVGVECENGACGYA